MGNTLATGTKLYGFVASTPLWRGAFVREKPRLATTYAVMRVFYRALREPGLLDPDVVRHGRMLVAFRDKAPAREPRVETCFRGTVGEPLVTSRFPYIGQRRMVYTLAEFEPVRAMPEELDRCPLPSARDAASIVRRVLDLPHFR